MTTLTNPTNPTKQLALKRGTCQLQTIEPGDWRVLNRPERREVAGDNRREKFKYFYFSVRNEEGRETK